MTRIMKLLVLVMMTACTSPTTSPLDTNPSNPDTDTPDTNMPDTNTPDANTSDAVFDVMTDAADTGTEPMPAEGWVGDRCDEERDCQSWSIVEDVPACIREGSWPNGGGWSFGYCTEQCSTTVRPEDGEALEQADCGADSLCLRARVDAPEVGICLLSCEEDSDCRDDYVCLKRYSLEGEPLEVGVCASWHCRSRGVGAC